MILRIWLLLPRFPSIKKVHCVRIPIYILLLPLVPPERMLTKALAVDKGTLFCKV